MATDVHASAWVSIATRLDADFDDALSSIAHPDRRRVLSILAHVPDEEISLQELANEHAASTRTALYHWHLPKLAAVDLVEWDPDRRVVRPGPRFGAIASFIGTSVTN